MAIKRLETKLSKDQEKQTSNDKLIFYAKNHEHHHLQRQSVERTRDKKQHINRKGDVAELD